MERLWETRTRWREGREGRERERRRASQRRGEAEGLRREARMLSRRAGMLFPLGAVVAVAGIVGLVGGLMWQRWMLALTALLPVGLSLLAWGRAEALRAKGLEREALRREEESSQWLEEAERVYSQVEDEARRLLKALGSYEGGEVKEEHFERAREVILRWEEVRRRLSDLERRAREVEESAGKARGEEEAARRRLEEEEGRLKVVLEMIGALAEGERPSPEAFERAWAAIKRWKEAKGAERKAKALLEEAVRNLREAEERLERAEAEVERILKEAKVESVEEFKRRAEGRRNFDRCLREVEGLERQIKALLAGRRREDLEAELERTGEERRELEEKVPELKGKPLPEGRPEELEEAEREARREESKLREEKRGLEEVIERIRRGPSLSEARARVEEAKWRYRREKEFSEELQWALDALREATQRFGERWAERLSDEIEPLAQRVLPRAYAEIYIASDLSLQVRPERGEKFFGPEHLSTGEREQIFLMLRACAARELSLRREPLPMILDEPFGHIDRPRREKLWRFLLDLSKEVQIVILTCHKEHLEEATKAAREKGLSVKTKEVGELDIALLNWPSEAEVHG
ncbi:MAG TPA: hypothetical protein EYP65_04430 [Armatimonadetes bacterium]|nr:hypothetical protein [Armatimonadota bacterium]